MSRGRRIATWMLFLATFFWLFTGEVREGPAALWPSVLAVVLAFVARDIYLALFLAGLSGAILLREGNPVGAFLDFFARHMLPALSDSWNCSVLVFTLMMGGFVEVLNRGGGMRALAGRMLGRGQSARRVGLGCYFVGWALFFDGLASAMLVGKTMRPLADRVRMSREKLAFIVDSTSSPIAGLALISTWVAYEMSQIRMGFEQIGDGSAFASVAPYQLLIQSLPYRFYNYFVLLLVLVVIWWGRDVGPMQEAEARAGAAEPDAGGADAVPPLGGGGDARGGLLVALLPLLILVAGVFGGLFLDGGGMARGFSIDSLVLAMGEANAALVFVWATAFASLAAILLASIDLRMRGGVKEGDGPLGHFLDGMRQMFLPGLILVLAWTLNSVIKEIGAASYLVSWLGDGLGAAWLPGLVFTLSALVSFSTGTSWGTMAIVMPLVIPLAARLTGLEGPADVGQVMLATIGAVLAGAVFGDHCSPISDTTIVSAFSSGCDLMAHVRTQLPYAVGAGVLAVAVGYGPAGMGVPPYLLLAMGVVVLVGWGAWSGRRWRRGD